MEAFLAEKYNVKVLNGPADLDTVVAGARVSMKDAKRVAFVVALGASAATTVSLALKQHNAAVGGSTKALSVANPYYVKQAPATKFTKVEIGAAQDTYVLTPTFATAAGVVILEVLEEDLDTNGGFAWVSLDIADTTALKLGAVLAFVAGSTRPSYTADI